MECARRHEQQVVALVQVHVLWLDRGVVRESLCRDPRLASPGGHEPRPGMRVGVWFLLQRENLLLIGRAGPPHRLPPLGIPSAARPRRTRGPAWAPSEVGGDFDAPAFLRCSDPARPRHQDEGGARTQANLDMCRATLANRSTADAGIRHCIGGAARCRGPAQPECGAVRPSEMCLHSVVAEDERRHRACQLV